MLSLQDSLRIKPIIPENNLDQLVYQHLEGESTSNRKSSHEEFHLVLKQLVNLFKISSVQPNPEGMLKISMEENKKLHGISQTEISIQKLHEQFLLLFSDPKKLPFIASFAIIGHIR
jgi:hypothetical protein